MTSGLLAKGRFGKQDFVYVAADDVYLCPSGEQLTYHYTNEEDGKTLRRYWTNACQDCALKGQCTTGKERRISRWEHEAVLEAVCGFRGLRPGIPIERDHAVRSKAATCSEEGGRGLVAGMRNWVRFSWLRQEWRAAQ